MATDLTVRLTEDRPGALSRVAEALGRAGVNIEGISEMGGSVHLLVDDAEPARGALEAAGLEVESEAPAVVVSVPDRPGELASITRRLADAGVNLKYLYLATSTRVVIGTEDPDGAARALGQG